MTFLAILFNFTELPPYLNFFSCLMYRPHYVFRQNDVFQLGKRVILELFLRYISSRCEVNLPSYGIIRRNGVE